MRRKTRFRFDDKNGDGTFYCNHCGPGNGIVLLRTVHAWDFKTIVTEIDRVLGVIGHRPAASPKAEPSADARSRDIRRMLDGARDNTVVTQYLHRRGLRIIPSILRGDAHHPYYVEGGGPLVGYFPAVLAPVVGPDGALRAAARIYNSPDVAKRKKTFGPIGSDPQIRLFDEFDAELGVAEGIENAIAAFEIFNIPTWSALTAGGLENFKPPPGIRRVHVFGDTDESFTGQKAAYTLAKRLKAEKIDVEVRLPPVAGEDWRDLLNDGIEL